MKGSESVDEGAKIANYRDQSIKFNVQIQNIASAFVQLLTIFP